ncbi:MAG: hypothetical protein E7402_03805 [Ruminococcaceae bacterium]|nr:hypothetical protein [Oscillospiraceae bacterium]
MIAIELHYFLTTNGSDGHSDYTQKLMETYLDVITLDGLPRYLCDSLMREWSVLAKQNHLRLEFVHNCLDNSIEGLLLPDLKTAVINRPVYEPRTDLSYLLQSKARHRFDSYMESAFDAFGKAKKIHDEWEKLYAAETDYNILNQVGEDIIASLLPKEEKAGGSLCDRFFGATTKNGSKDYVDALSQNTERYFIKGRPGTGKSTFLKKLAQAACDRGFFVERYHCSLDPKSLDMVVIRELSLCFFDSTAPHEYFPSRAADHILDFYALAVTKGTDEKLKKELDDVSDRYYACIRQAVKDMDAADAVCREWEMAYLPHIDTQQVTKLRNNVLARLLP